MNSKILALCLALPWSTSMAANYYVDFDSPSYVIDQSLDGVDGWSVNHTSPAPDQPLAFTGARQIGVGGPISQTAAIGGYYDNNPAGVPTTEGPLTLSRTFSSLPTGEKSISFIGVILDSTTEFGPDRDTFGFSVKDGEGNLLLTVSLVPVEMAGTPEETVGEWEVFYAFGDDALQTTTSAVREDDAVTYEVEFLQSGIRFGFGDGETMITRTGNPLAYDLDDNDLELTYFWDAGPDDETGDNTLLIDNLAVVPEPSSILLGGLGLLGFLARRRRL